MNITEKNIIKQFWKFTSNHIIVPNVKYFDCFESDIIAVKDNIAIEYEIKISPNDYIAEFKNKEHKHRAYKLRRDGIPNMFYFIMPKGMIQKEGIPTDYGLIEFEEKYMQNGRKRYSFLDFSYTRIAKMLHDKPINRASMNKLLISMCYRHFNKK